MTSFHERINLLYKESQLLDYTIGRKSFAELIGATRSQINGWLDGMGRPDMEQLREVASKLGVEVEWLIGESDFRSFLPCCFTGLPSEAEEEYQYLLAYLELRLQNKSTKCSAT